MAMGDEKAAGTDVRCIECPRTLALDGASDDELVAQMRAAGWDFNRFNAPLCPEHARRRRDGKARDGR